MKRKGFFRSVADVVTGSELYGVLVDSTMTREEAVRCIVGIGVVILACWACG